MNKLVQVNSKLNLKPYDYSICLTCVILLYKTSKMNGHSVVFEQLVQKLEQITPNSSTLQDEQNEWSQCSIWTVGSKVRTNNTKQFCSARRSK